jgi:hypothetical protein
VESVVEALASGSFDVAARLAKGEASEEAIVDAASRSDPGAAILALAEHLREGGSVLEMLAVRLDLAHGRRDRAIATLRNRVARYPSSTDEYVVAGPLAWELLAEALAASGDAAGARDAAQHALAFWKRADADFVPAQRARKLAR